MVMEFLKKVKNVIVVVKRECKGNPLVVHLDVKLKEGAACSDGNEPAVQKCQFRKAEEQFKCFTSKSRRQLIPSVTLEQWKMPGSQKAVDGSQCEL